LSITILFALIHLDNLNKKRPPSLSLEAVVTIRPTAWTTQR